MQNPLQHSDPTGENTLILNGGRLLLVPVPGARIVGGALILIGGAALVYDMCTEDDDEDAVDCGEWLQELQDSYLLINALYPSPLQGQAEKQAHDQSVDFFCTFCPEECGRAPRFGIGRAH